MGSQFFRGLALHWMQSGRVGIILLAVTVFLDKYSGPLGMAALDTTLLNILKYAGAGPSGRFPATATL